MSATLLYFQDVASEVKSDIAIIGGGVIGLSCAWRLAQGGAKVALFERGTCGREASYAAAGMIAPLIEAARHPPQEENARRAMLALCLQSRDLYGSFVDELSSLSETKVDLSLSGSSQKSSWPQGTFYLAANDEDKAPSAFAAMHDLPTAPLKLQREVVERKWWKRKLPKGIGTTARIKDYPFQVPDEWLAWLDKGRLFWLNSEGRVNNRQLVKALSKEIRRQGVQVFQSKSVRGLRRRGDQIVGVTTEEQTVHYKSVLICAGAWSRHIENTPLYQDERFAPVKGQMVQLSQTYLPLNATVYASDVYLVPRSGGRCLVGATMEKGEVDRYATVQGVQELLKSACQLIPSLRTARVETTWAGLRPATPDGLPILGSTPLKNLFVATGHFRNGILLTPITAQLMADCLLNDKEPPSEFSMGRFF